MGVIYKLREEVVHFIISQRQSNPLASCRQLAESTSQKFGLHLSKSSVHDVLKESGIVTPRGRKPKNKFAIPQEKKKQIQVSLSQVNLIPPIPEDGQAKIVLIADVTEAKQEPSGNSYVIADEEKQSQETEISPEYEGAGRIFIKAALWDLGIFSEEKLKGTDGKYYLTYSKGIRVSLENNKSFFIDLSLPLERCIREVADGLINNIKYFIIGKVSDEGLLKSCMDAQTGSKINTISIVDENDHVLLEFDNIMELKRNFLLKNRVFVESYEYDIVKRSESIFFPQMSGNNEFIEYMLNIKGFDTINKEENVITLLIDDAYDNKTVLKEAAEKLNGMYLYDEQNRIVKVVINPLAASGDSVPLKAAN